MKTIAYSDLERHFSAPKRLSPHYDHKRLPRKLKKRLKAFVGTKRYDFLDLNQRLWLYLWHTNPNYCNFLIKQIIRHDDK